MLWIILFVSILLMWIGSENSNNWYHGWLYEIIGIVGVVGLMWSGLSLMWGWV